MKNPFRNFFKKEEKTVMVNSEIAGICNIKEEQLLKAAKNLHKRLKQEEKYSITNLSLLLWRFIKLVIFFAILIFLILLILKGLASIPWIGPTIKGVLPFL